MLNPDNLYFINTPVDIQDECYYDVIDELNELNFIKEEHIVYLCFSKIHNLLGKACFKCYLKNHIEENKVFDYEPDFLIFIQK